MTKDDTQPWRRYKRPFVRDLAFAIACPGALKQWFDPYQPTSTTTIPSVISNSPPTDDSLTAEPSISAPSVSVHSAVFWQTQFKNYASRLTELDTSPHYKQLTKYLLARPSPYRLGFHFEGLIHFWLQDGYRLGLHPYEVLAHNVQLYRDKQTIGELDFVLRNHDTQLVEHWEIAIKFYLGAPPYQLKDWVGLNRKDNFALKMTHMQTKQFRAIWVDLDGYNSVKIDKRYVVIKGRFFESAQQPFYQTVAQPLDHCVKPDATVSGAKRLQPSLARPSWLNTDFPYHQWHAICSDEDLRQLAMPNLRAAHYIERFTYRPFYDAAFLMQQASIQNSHPKSALAKNRWPYTPLQFADLDTNLYMNEGHPVILVVTN